MSGANPRIVILHYHLRRGGVTRVIETACRELTERGAPVVVISGEAPETPFPEDAAPVRVVPTLGYNERTRHGPGTVRSLMRKITDEAVAALGGAPDVWHFHNAALGKNPAVTMLADTLARDGTAVLSQIHDFAEDQRPENWRLLVETLGNGAADKLDKHLYPAAAHARIAVLNERDRRILLNAGADPQTVALLPNPVTVPEGEESAAGFACTDFPRRWVYPTRAIRRKNLGEFVLWAATGDKNDRFATTLAPTHPRDRKSYDRWKSTAASLRLPIRFDVGLAGEEAFRQVMHAATALATTSVAEGFGLAFLEPWLRNKAAVGRRLPEITADMEATGVDLSMLYDRFEVPLQWIGRDRLQARITAGLEQTYRSYSANPPRHATEKAMAAILRDDNVDFGGLDETLQREAVLRVANSRHDAAILQPSLPTGRVAAETIARNRCLIEENYAPAAYGKRLHELYAKLLRAREKTSHIPATKVLRQFLQPQRFRLLRM